MNVKNIYTLREYQKNLILKTLSTNSSTLIQLPTGTGKTIIAKHIISQLVQVDKKVLFIVPKIVLLDQTVDVFHYLNPQIIHKNKNYDSNQNLFISTVQTISRKNDMKYDVIFIDEIHFGYDGKMIDKIKSINSTARIIGLSATPYDKNGEILKGFDLVLDRYDMKYMIEKNYLTSLNSYVLVKQNSTKIKITAGDYNLKELGELACKDYLITEITNTTKKYILKSNKTIVFAVNIEHTKLLQISYRHLGFDVEILHSKQSNDEIKHILKEFKETSTKPKVLISVLMLTTGFNMPEVDCAVLARPTKSQNLYKQMVGRILRLHENKKSAFLLDCANIIENLGMPLDSIKYKKVKKYKPKLKCKECGSTYFKLIKHNGEFQWKCQECESCFPSSYKNGFTCNFCKEVHNKKEFFSMNGNELILNCPCGKETLISSTKGEQKLMLISENVKYLCFKEAREYVRNQKLKDINQWKIYKRIKPKYIPKNPNEIYKDLGWISWNDWIGNDKDYKRKYLSYVDAKKYLVKLELNSMEKYKEYFKNRLDENIPQFPEHYYRKTGWITWDDYFGKNTKNDIPNRFKVISFNQAKKSARELNLSSLIQWKDHYSNCYPKYDYPLQPKEIFSKDWKGWDDWLGLD